MHKMKPSKQKELLSQALLRR